MHINLAVLGTRSINWDDSYYKRISFPLANNEGVALVVKSSYIDIMIYVSIMTNEIPNKTYSLFISKGEKSLKLIDLSIDDFKKCELENMNRRGGYKYVLVWSGLNYNITYNSKLGEGEYMVALCENKENDKPTLLLSTPIYLVDNGD